METKSALQLLVFLCFGIGWVIFFHWFFRKLKSRVAREIKDESLAWSDLLALALSSVAFYYKFMRDINDQIIGDSSSAPYLTLILFYVWYFVCLGVFGFFRANIPLRYGIIALCLYVGVGLSPIIFYLGGYTNTISFWLQLWAIFNWFLIVIFPMEIGNVARIVIFRLKPEWREALRLRLKSGRR